MQKDGEVVKPTYQKWITWVDKLKKIELCARVNPNVPPNAIPTTRLVKSLKDFQILPDDMEAKWTELKGNFETFANFIVPLLLHIIGGITGSVKAYQEWSDETLDRVNLLMKRVLQENNMQLLQRTLNRLVNSDIFYDDFIKEVNQATIKYTPYRNKANQIAEHKWPSDEEFQDWIKRYMLDEE